MRNAKIPFTNIPRHWPVLLGVALFPAGVLLTPDVGKAVFMLFALFGVICTLRDGLQCSLLVPFVRLLSQLTFAFVLVALFSVLLSGDFPAGLDQITTTYHFLAAPFIAVIMANTKISTQFILRTVKTSSILVLLVVFFQYCLGNQRPGGAVHPLILGCLVLLLGFFSLIRYPLESKAEKLFSLLAFIAGCLACVLAQARVMWAISLLLFVGLHFIWRRAGILSKRNSFILAGAYSLVLLSAVSMPVVQQRVDNAANEIHSIQENGEWRNSLGNRIVMWQSGFKAAADKPLTGWGAHRTQQAAASVLDDPEMQNMVLRYNHLHNEYLSNVVGKGLLGLISLLLLFFVPLVVFIKFAASPGHLVPAAMGFLLCLTYAASSLTNVTLGEDVLNMFFIFFLAITLLGLRERDNDAPVVVRSEYP